MQLTPFIKLLSSSKLIAQLYYNQQMKDRNIYSPNTLKQSNPLDIKFKKSPQKIAYYDSPLEPQPYPFTSTQTYFPNPRDFDNLKKVSDEVSSLRQTMSSKRTQRLLKRHTFEANDEDQKPTKINDFLRQTMSYKSTKAFSQKFGSEIASTNEAPFKKEDIFNTYKTSRTTDPYKMLESKSAINLIEESKGINQVELLNQKIDRNKRLIEQLRKGQPKQIGTDYLKNINYQKSPTYLDLDRQKQTDDKGFRKKKKQESANFMTPKLDKGTYDNRFNNSPITNADIHKQQDKPKEHPITSLRAASPLRRKESANYVIKQSSLIDEFEVGKKLGEGKFGCVNLVRQKKSLGLFALKKIPKALIKTHMMVDQLSLQIKLQSCLNHKNILGMYGFFDDKTHLYIVLEYMNGGTLFEKLKKGGKLLQKEAASVIKQITSSIDYLHDMGIAHRDLKPQNIVISNNVYKLCDFGWATLCDERRKTYCGTFDYVAPQILEGVDYDMTVDLWCLGVLTYELMTGKAPFYHISRKETMKRILNVENETIVYPQTMSELARDFIDKLIRKNPLERIRANQALLHPFIKDADLD